MKGILDLLGGLRIENCGDKFFNNRDIESTENTIILFRPMGVLWIWTVIKQSLGWSRVGAIN